jgi:hypothetical protein
VHRTYLSLPYLTSAIAFQPKDVASFFAHSVPTSLKSLSVIQFVPPSSRKTDNVFSPETPGHSWLLAGTSSVQLTLEAGCTSAAFPRSRTSYACPCISSTLLTNRSRVISPNRLTAFSSGIFLSSSKWASNFPGTHQSGSLFPSFSRDTSSQTYSTSISGRSLNPGWSRVTW